MMLVYKGPGPVHLPDARLTITPDVPTDIPAALAPGLLARPGWSKAPVPKPAEKKEA